jgi:hypothetical protein
MHYALEDFHGYNKYGTPAKSFEAYCQATFKIRQRVQIPVNFDELNTLGVGMLNYYSNSWLQDRDPLKTFVVDGVPQVEVRCVLEIPWNPKEHYPSSPYDKVVYGLTIDRVIEDENDGRLWLVDYKSAKSIQTSHLATDPQISAYYWAGRHLYPNRDIAGFIYQQHRKDVPAEPRITAMGRLSTDKRQLVTHRSYRRVLVNLFTSDSSKWPQENLDFLNYLAANEEVEQDKFIRRDRVYRNQYQAEAEGTKILLELEDMLNPNLPLYPNPTRECSYCPFHNPCVSMDDGSDYEYDLSITHERSDYTNHQDLWREHLPLPFSL